MIYANKYLHILKYLVILLFIINIIRNNLTIPLPIFITLCVFLIINDLIRNNLKHSLKYFFSLILSIIGAALLKYYINAYEINIFMLLYVIEIFYVKGTTKFLFLIFHCFLYFTIVVFSTRSLHLTERLTAVGVNLLTYSVIVLILYLSHTVRNEREDTKKLNEELEASNTKLQEYSLKVRGTFYCERKRKSWHKNYTIH